MPQHCRDCFDSFFFLCVLYNVTFTNLKSRVSVVHVVFCFAAGWTDTRRWRCFRMEKRRLLTRWNVCAVYIFIYIYIYIIYIYMTDDLQIGCVCPPNRPCCCVTGGLGSGWVGDGGWG